MTHFPVSSSILSAKHLTSFLQEKYRLSPDTHCQILKSGINDTYKVSDGGSIFVWRVYSLGWRSREEISEELKFLQQLKEKSIAISYPIADIKNNYVQTLQAPEGDRFAVLFSYANGAKQHIVSAETHFQIGQLMAQIHKISCGMTLDKVQYTPEILLNDSLIKISKFLSDESEEMRFMKSTQAFLIQEWHNIDFSKMRQGIVHLDIWFDNLNVDEEGRATIFDFDFCGNGLLALDIAYYVKQLHNVERYEEKEYQPKVDSFMIGYESVNPISDEEKRLIPILGISLYYFYLGVQCHRYDNWSNSFLSENYLKRFINGIIIRYFNIYNLGKNIS